MAKVRVRSAAGPSPLPVLAHVLERTLRLLHPFMPFITEEIWSLLLPRLPQEGGFPESIMVSSYPQPHGGRQDQQAEEEISLVMQTIRAVRNTRAQLRIPAKQSLEAVVQTNGLQRAIEEEAELIRTLSRIEPLHIQSADSSPGGDSKGVTLVVNPMVVRLPLEGVVDLSAEAARLRQEMEDCLSNLERVSALVANPNFRAKARPEVVETEQERLRTLEERKQRLGEILLQIGG
jgi:valyl-tRNA synthetase